MKQKIEKYLHEIVDQTMNKFEIPAVVAVTMNSSEVLECCAVGTRIWGRNEPVTIEDYFHIGSCSKSILAMIAAKTVEENLIQWNTGFFQIFPEMIPFSKANYLSITLKDLLTCRAGIKEFTSGAEQYPDNVKENPYEFAKWLVSLDSAASVRNNSFDFLYSNASYAMASLLLEKVTNKTYKELIQHHIIQGLGIEVQMGFPNKFDIHQPWGHLLTKTNPEIFTPENEYQLNSLLIPAGDLSMKPLAFAKYIQMHLNGLRGNSNYLNSESYKVLHFSDKGFSIGIVNTKIYGLSISGIDGSAGTFFCRAIIIPSKNFAMTIMTNAGTGTAQMEAIDWLSKQIAKKQFNWWWKFWM